MTSKLAIGTTMGLLATTLFLASGAQALYWSGGGCTYHFAIDESSAAGQYPSNVWSHGPASATDTLFLATEDNGMTYLRCV